MGLEDYGQAINVAKAAPEVGVTVTDAMHSMEMSLSNLDKAAAELRERLDGILRHPVEEFVRAELVVPESACMIANHLVGYDREIQKIYWILADINGRVAL